MGRVRRRGAVSVLWVLWSLQEINETIRFFPMKTKIRFCCIIYRRHRSKWPYVVCAIKNRFLVPSIFIWLVIIMFYKIWNIILNLIYIIDNYICTVRHQVCFSTCINVHAYNYMYDIYFSVFLGCVEFNCGPDNCSCFMDFDECRGKQFLLSYPFYKKIWKPSTPLDLRVNRSLLISI